MDAVEGLVVVCVALGTYLVPVMAYYFYLDVIRFRNRG